MIVLVILSLFMIFVSIKFIYYTNRKMHEIVLKIRSLA